jgi:hypothetical protein
VLEAKRAKNGAIIGGERAGTSASTEGPGTPRRRLAMSSRDPNRPPVGTK